MLKSLLIRNFAIIDREEVEFASGLNIITGETGAGKSIMVDALMMALGERASTDSVRQGESKAVIEAIFALDPNGEINKYIKSEGYDSFGSELILRREISSKGNSRAFVNDSPAPAGMVKSIGEMLVDFHGQHQHQSLLHQESHIEILDSIGYYDDLLNIYNKHYRELSDLINSYKDLSRRERSLREKEDLLRFKLREINAVDPQPCEDAELEQELKIRENSEKLFSLTSDIYSELFVGERSIHDRLSSAVENLENLASIDSAFSEYTDELNSSTIAVNEISKFIKDYNSSIEFNPERIEKIRSRLLELKGLKKKFGAIDEIIQTRSQIEDELNLIENYDSEIEKSEKSILSKQSELGKSASELSQARNHISKEISQKIELILAELGMPDSKFRVEVSQKEFRGNDPNIHPLAEIDGKLFEAGSGGIDRVEFMISTNLGESPLPLRSVASGGEISRIMLAIKSITAGKDNLALMVFDEIDTGISGRIAQKTGVAIKKLSLNTQIIAITHLPQIAAMGDLNFNVIKQESNGRTIARAIKLNANEKTSEIARLIAGENVSEAALKSASELISKASEIG
ncbi:MAG: DNA repair protein RecN [Candidatus Kapaibacterium sp.]